MRKKIIAFAACNLLCNTFIKAQIVPAPEGKTTIEAEAELRGTQDVEDAVDGEMYAHLYASHNFIYSHSQKLGIEGRYEYNSSNLHYFRLAVKGNKNFKLSNGHPIVVNANIYGEASNHGVEYFDGYITCAYMYQTTPKQQQGVGIVALIHNPSGIPCVPIYFFNKTFDNRWSFNFLTYLASLNCDLNKKVRFSGGYAMSSQRFWVEDEGQVRMVNRALFTPQLAFRWKPLPDVSFIASAGYRVTVVDDVYTRHGGDKLYKAKKGAAPFILARAVISLSPSRYKVEPSAPR